MFTKKCLLACAVACLVGSTRGQPNPSFMQSGADASGSLYLTAAGLDASGFSQGTSTGFSNSDFSGGASSSISEIMFEDGRFGRSYFEGEADSEASGGGGNLFTFGGSAANTRAGGEAVQIPGINRVVDISGGGGAMAGAQGENELGTVFDETIVAGDTNPREGIFGRVVSEADSVGGATNEDLSDLFRGTRRIERFNDFIAGLNSGDRRNRKLLQNILALESGGGASLNIGNGASGAAGQANYGSAFDGIFFEGTQTVSAAGAGVSRPGRRDRFNRAAAGGGADAGNDCGQDVFEGFEITNIPENCGQYAESQQTAAAANENGVGSVSGGGEADSFNAPSGYSNQLSVATNEQEGDIGSDSTSIIGGFSGGAAARATGGGDFADLAIGFGIQAFDTANNIGPAIGDIRDVVGEFIGK